MRKTMIAVACLSLATAVTGRAQPITVHPENAHYFRYHGRPTVLITSAEHYGAVVNRGFDYRTYLDTLKSYGLNYTQRGRVWHEL